MVNKKGQVALFVIIAIVIVAVALSVIYLKPNFLKKQTNPELDPIKQYVNDKIFETTIDGLYILSLRGGYLNLTEPRLEYLDYVIKMYNETNFPSKDHIRQDLETYVQDNLKSKLNFSDFEKQGFEVVSGNPKANITLGNKIKTNLNLPLTIQINDQISNLKDFSTELNFDFDFLYSLVRETYTDVKDEINLTKEYNYPNTNISIVTLNINDYVVVLAINNSLTNMPLYWIYSVTHNWTSLFDFPEMYTIPDFNITNATEFKYQVQAVGKNLTYYDDSDLFEINRTTGLIDFNVTKEMNGDHSILIRVIDIKEQEDSKFMNLNINITE